MNGRKLFITSIGVVIGICILCAFIYVLIFFVAFGGLTFLVHVPKPEIKYAEFPFELTYELDGETITIKDSIVCEFDGFKVVGEAGKYRKWKSYLKSNGKERITLLDLRPKGEKHELGYDMLELYFSYGEAKNYMESGKIHTSIDYCEIPFLYKTQEGITGGSSYKADEAYEKYGLRIIDWNCAPPIKNTFR